MTNALILMMGFFAWGSAQAATPCGDEALSLPKTLKRVASDLVDQVLPGTEQKLNFVVQREIDDGEMSSDPAYVEFRFAGKPGAEGAVFHLNTYSVTENTSDYVRIVSQGRETTHKKTSLLTQIFDWAVAEETGHPPRSYRRRGSWTEYDFRLTETEVRYTMRRGKLIYFEAWSRVKGRVFDRTVAHVVFGSP